jgi:hypothetical protein
MQRQKLYLLGLIMPRRRNPSVSDSADLKTIASRAVKLSQPERTELIAILQALQEAENEPLLEKQERALFEIPARGRLKEEALNRRGLRGGQGSFEDKIINGCAPYRYLRYWFGKTHKSVYLGRVE